MGVRDFVAAVVIVDVADTLLQPRSLVLLRLRRCTLFLCRTRPHGFRHDVVQLRVPQHRTHDGHFCRCAGSERQPCHPDRWVRHDLLAHRDLGLRFRHDDPGGGAEADLVAAEAGGQE